MQQNETMVALLEPDVELAGRMQHALATAGVSVIAASFADLSDERSAALKAQVLLFGAAAEREAQSCALALRSRQGGTPAIAVYGLADALNRIALLDSGVACAFSESTSFSEIAAQVRSLIRLRLNLLGDAQTLRTSHGLLAQLQDDLQLGARIQQSFLPPLSIQTPTFALEARIQASWTLSGDFFDYKFITPERLAVFIADISGHGVASALLASRLKAFFDEHYRNARRAARTLEHLNRMLIELGEHQQFATAVLMCIDISEGSLTYANAGHRTLYMLDREQGHYTPLPSSGPALGLFEDCEIGERDFTFLPKRKRLVAYTDGLIELKNKQRDDWLSEEEFVENLILPALGRNTAEFTDTVFAGSRSLNGGDKWDDDVCLVVVDC